MGLTIRCGTCHKHLAVTPQMQGRRIRCPGCKEIMRVPAAGAMPAADAEKSEPMPEAGEHVTAAAPSARRRTAPAEDRTDSPQTAARRPRPRRATSAPRARDYAWMYALSLCGALALIALAVGAIGLSTQWFGLQGKPNMQAAQAAQAELPLPPPPKLEEMPEEDAPPDLADDRRRKVIQATAYLKVTRSANVVQEGSGYFAAEPGLLLTSAHVVGMGASGCSAPASIEVVIHRGESDEATLHGHVLAADWISDLAVVRVAAPVEKLPAPLAVASSRTLRELQKVYIFGYPLGAGLGKDVTVSESSIKSLRKDSRGALNQIQVASNILPGNSGGPIVDSRGVVVGTAVAFLGAGSPSFAVPGEKVHDLLRGRVEGLQMGEPYRDKDQTRLPLRLSCLDPLQRVRDVRVEVWVGTSGEVRPSLVTRPEARTGDGPRQVLPVDYHDGIGAIEVELPPLAKDQVLWVQPVLTDGGGTTRWTTATAYTPTGLPPLERHPAEVRLLLDSVPERSVKLHYREHNAITIGSNQHVSKAQLDINLLERLRPDIQGGEYQLYPGPCQALYENNGVKGTASPQLLNLLAGDSVQYKINGAGSWLQRSNPGLKTDAAGQPLMSYYQLINDLANAYEATCVALPNRQVQARETWPARLPLLVADPFHSEAAALVVTCTYEGRRLVDGNPQAVITIAGIIEGGNPPRTLGGKVTGTFHVALDQGYVARADVNIEHLFGKGNVFTHRLIDVSLTRAPGNALGIVPRGPVARGKTLFETSSMLDATDRTDLRPKCASKVFPVKLQAGQAYVFEMNRAGAGLFDPYLLLRDPDGEVVAEDDDSGGNQNARILHTPLQSGVYEVCATTCDPGQSGTFQLLVAERAPPRNTNASKKSAEAER